MPAESRRYQWHLLAASSCLLLTQLHQIVGGDLFWHIPVGSYLLEKSELLRQDIFSHTMLGKEVMPHGPWFQATVAWVHDLSGWAGLCLLRALLVLSLYFTIDKFIRRFSTRSLFTPWWSLVLLWLAYPQLALHPQLCFFIFLMILLVVGPLFSHNKTTIKQTLVATSIVTLWPLFHPSFLAGLIILFVYALYPLIFYQQRSIRNSLLWFSSLIVSGTAIFFVDPSLYQNVATHAASPVMLANVRYWQPTWRFLSLSSPTDLWLIALLLIILVVAIKNLVLEKLWHPRRTMLLPIFLSATLLAFGSLRFYPLIPLVVGPLALPVILQAGRLMQPKPACVGAAILLMCTSLFVLSSPAFHLGWGLYEENLPKAGMTFLQKHALPGNIYNSYNYGGYLIYQFREDKKVFIDPRSSQVYPDTFLERFIAAYDKPKLFEELVREYRVGHTFIQNRSAKTKKLLNYLDSSKRWTRAYQDPICTIHQLKPDSME